MAADALARGLAARCAGRGGLLGESNLDDVSIDHLYVEVSGVGGGLPPCAPSSLVATEASSSVINVGWVDRSNNEEGFELQSSGDGVMWSALPILGANVESYSDSGLNPLTTRFYRVRAVNASGESAWSNVDSATTLTAGAADIVASGEILGSGTVSGTYTDTHAADNVAQSILERESGGKPARRYSYLEHTWVFNVGGNGSVELHLDGWREDMGEMDLFDFEWSTDQTSWTTALTLSTTSPAAGYESPAVLSSGLAGTIFVRAVDQNRSPGTRNLDRLHVDHLFLRVQ